MIFISIGILTLIILFVLILISLDKNKEKYDCDFNKCLEGARDANLSCESALNYIQRCYEISNKNCPKSPLLKPKNFYLYYKKMGDTHDKCPVVKSK